MTNSEFTDTYSDDLIYLSTMRKSTLSHPLINVSPPLFSASLCRIYCTFIIGNIESMLNDWSKYENSLFEAYYKESENYAKVEELNKIFKKNGINTDSSIIEDFLAMKYLRNIIVHSISNVKYYMKKQIEKCGFPMDVRELNDIHLTKMINVNDKMLSYIAMVTFFSGRFTQWNSKDVNSIELPKIDRIIYKEDISKIFWNNLIEIKGRIRQTFSNNLQEHNISVYKEIQTLSEQALFFWDEYKRYELNSDIFLVEKIENYFEIINELMNNKSFVKINCEINILKKLFYNLEEQGIENEQLNTLFDGKLKFSSKDCLEAIVVGDEIYNKIQNISILSLFIDYLPFLLPQKGLTIIKEARNILIMFKLSQYYYYYIEKNSNTKDLDNIIKKYEDKLEKLEVELIKE